MSAQVIIQGTLKPDGTLELDQKPMLSPGRVRVTVEAVAEPARPESPRFGTLKGSILYIAPDFDAIPEGFEDYLP